MKPNLRFIVTGGAGLIGSNLVAALNRRNHENILIVDNLNHPEKQKNLDRLRYADYLDKYAYRERIRSGTAPEADTLFHLGACSATTETDADYLEDNNLVCSQELCRWALDHGTRFIYASSAATYGDGSQGYVDDTARIDQLQPLNLYGLSKQRFDLWARDNGLLPHIAGIKYFNVYGPGENHKGNMRSLVHKAWNQIRDTGRLQLFRSHHPDYEDGCQQRDFLYVRDAVDMTLFFHDNPSVSGLFNAGTGTPHTWLELAHAIFGAMQRAPAIDFIDIPPAIRDKYQYYTCADMTKLRAAGFGAPCTPLAQAVETYISYLNQQWETSS